MEILGHISFKKIFYFNVRTEQNWFTKLPGDKWIAFIIADNGDASLIADVAVKCLDRNASCICNAGQLALNTYESFAEELELRKMQREQELDELEDKAGEPALTFHTNFSEGFWYATSIANPSIADTESDIDKVLCIDMTENSVKKCIRDLIGKFNSGELPSDSEYEEPVYDGETE